MCQDLAKCEINNFMNDVAAWTWEKSLEERVCLVIYMVYPLSNHSGIQVIIEALYTAGDIMVERLKSY